MLKRLLEKARRFLTLRRVLAVPTQFDLLNTTDAFIKDRVMPKREVEKLLASMFERSEYDYNAGGHQKTLLYTLIAREIGLRRFPLETILNWIDQFSIAGGHREIEFFLQAFDNQKVKIPPERIIKWAYRALGDWGSKKWGAIFLLREDKHGDHMVARIVFLLP